MTIAAVVDAANASAATSLGRVRTNDFKEDDLRVCCE
jgi:hypothetical protein